MYAVPEKRGAYIFEKTIKWKCKIFSSNYSSARKFKKKEMKRKGNEDNQLMPIFFKSFDERVLGD